MNTRRLRFGSIAVLFTVAILCVAIFAALTVMTARADARVAEQYGRHIKTLYDCENMGQRWLAQADAYLQGAGPLPEGTEQDGKLLQTMLACDSMQLFIRLLGDDDGYEILQWSCTTRWEPDQNLNLWEQEP